MDLRKIAVSEHFSSNSKLVSGFGIGVLVSLLVFSLVLINNPFQISFFNASSGSYASFPWFFPQPNAVISTSSPPESVEEETVAERNRPGNLATGDKNAVVLSSGVGDRGLEKTQEGNCSKNADKGSFRDGKQREMEKTGIGNASETLKEANFSNFGSWDTLREKTPEGNVSRSSGKGSSLSKEDTVMGNIIEGNSSEDSKNGSSLTAGEGERIREMTRDGNFSSNLKNGNSFSGVEMVNDTIHEEKSPPETKKDSSISKNNVFQFDEKNKTREGNPSKEAKEKSSESNNGSPSPEVDRSNSKKCDIFNGRWVRDEGKPYYPSGSCPLIDKDFDCRANGRPDYDFLKWRWQPNDCNIPSMNATDFLDRLRGKRLLFVGDSLNRNMWESLVCILRDSILDKRRVHEISGRSEFKTKGYYSFRYEDYDCSIDFVQSPFLVKPSSTKLEKGEHETLRLDLMDDVTPAYGGADVLVFNTGHWWTHEKTSKGIDYYQEGNYVHPTLNVLEAYEKALKTWAKWIDKNIDARKTRVFFRGYSLTHFSGGQWNSGGQCHNETEPIFNESYLVSYPSKMRALERVLDHMKTPVVYLNISRLTDYRKDGHPSIFRKVYKTDHQTQDCSHWCLPGVPDTWNELLYASLVMNS